MLVQDTAWYLVAYALGESIMPNFTCYTLSVLVPGSSLWHYDYLGNPHSTGEAQSLVLEGGVLIDYRICIIHGLIYS